MISESAQKVAPRTACRQRPAAGAFYRAATGTLSKSCIFLRASSLVVVFFLPQVYGTEAPINQALESVSPSTSLGSPSDRQSPAALDRLVELNVLSQALVDRAGSGSAPAHQFRIEARMYRELLRRLMLDNRAMPEEKRLPEPLLLDMVRMSALLHSAADCKTGFIITCPADLMVQLRLQQAKIDQASMLGTPSMDRE